MTLIGDILISAREMIPDMCSTLGPATATAAVVAAPGSTLPVGTYAVIVTWRNQWGETLEAGETLGLVVAANQGIQITSTLPPGATTIRAYLTSPGGAAGSEQQFVESIVSPFVISAPPVLASALPTRSTAWLPDSDGQRMFSVGTLYRWLNQGLSRLARKAGVLQDYTAVGTVAGQPLYVMAGEWAKITNVWYDGSPLALGSQGSFFRRNTITSSVLASCAVSIRTNQLVIELFYQPARTAGASTLSAQLGIADIGASCAPLGGFQSFGPPMFAQIGTEIVAFSQISGTNLLGLIRGLGGTVPQVWPSGTAVKELNVPLLGKRLSTQNYVPGNSANLLPVPLGWEEVLPIFILSRARESEQDRQSAAALLKQFDDAVMDYLRANRQIAGPTQVGGSSWGVDTVPGFGSSMGGVVLP